MNESIEKQERVRFYVDKNSLLVKTAVIFMAASAVLRIIGVWGLWDSAFFTTTQIVMPIACNVLFILCLLFLGGKFFSLSSISVLLGAVFFIVKATDFVWWKMLISIIAYLATAVLYTAVAFGIVRTKWPLVPVFAVPFAVHLAYDISRLGDTVNPVTLSDGMQELSVLCIILSLLFTSLAVKKQKNETEKEKQPRIRLPKFENPFKKKSETTAETEIGNSTDRAQAAVQNENQDNVSAPCTEDADNETSEKESADSTEINPGE